MKIPFQTRYLKRKGDVKMSVVILGGNSCMEHRYKALCKDYRCQVKIFTNPVSGLKNKLGTPDLVIFFTSAMSHKMVQGALCELKGTDAVIERCRTSSMAALREVLDRFTGREA